MEYDRESIKYCVEELFVNLDESRDAAARTVMRFEPSTAALVRSMSEERDSVSIYQVPWEFNLDSEAAKRDS